ncbi:hypothetical protein [Okeania sp. SIO2B3]|uniref:hypothetical protein n=1 Tax=Okeania sp. SIO2B3 TaxID=2607784 RepID=UPI0013C17B16|nr:hypothetical protein [Okeania sp. SIO2B3]NET40801.1 hypothetical protein [Okeania sp. SIO2B3]
MALESKNLIPKIERGDRYFQVDEEDIFFISIKLLLKKLITLQNKLKELSSGELQKFADVYLHKKIEQVKSIKSLGSVSGTKKNQKRNSRYYFLALESKNLIAKIEIGQKGDHYFQVEEEDIIFISIKLLLKKLMKFKINSKN